MNTRRPSLKREALQRRIFNYFLLAFVIVLGFFLSSRLQLGHQRYLFLSPDHYPPSSIQSINLKLSKGGKIYVVNDANQFYVLLAKDSYDSCLVVWNKTEQAFISPCSKSKYTVHGKWISGPSRKDLDRFATYMRGGNLVIDTERRIAGATYDEAPPQ